MALVKTFVPAFLLLAGCASTAIVRDDAAGTVTVTSHGRPLVTWHADAGSSMPHWTLVAPSGRALLIEHPDPYPHHRAMWLADKAQLGDGPIVDFYHGRPPEAKSCLRQIGSPKTEVMSGKVACVGTRLQWLANGQPTLDDARLFVVSPLPSGDAVIDLSWQWTASYGPVTFHSDWIHYAWPLLRLHPQFSVAQGGTLVDDQGRTGQAATNGQYANWVDYSNTLGGLTEGVAVFVPQDGEWRKWLTRDYGAFGPRRPDPQNGVPFTLPQGETLSGTARILVHRGDAVTGRVAEHYRQYVEGR